MAIIKNVRIAFADGLFNAKSAEEGKPRRYSASFLFPPDHPAKAQIEKLVDEAGAEAFGKDWPVVKKDKIANNKLVLHEGGNKTHEGFDGNLYFIAYNLKRPTIKDRDGVTNLVESDGRPYSGCYVNAHIDVSAYTHKNPKYGKLISITLTGVQFVKDGDSWAGGVQIAKDSDFVPLTEGVDEEDLV